MIMSVRKGKRLIARLLSFLSSSQAATVVMGIARNLPALAKKDKQDQVAIPTFSDITSVLVFQSVIFTLLHFQHHFALSKTRFVCIVSPAHKTP